MNYWSYNMQLLTQNKGAHCQNLNGYLKIFIETLNLVC
jgi:hypothetical protein